MTHRNERYSIGSVFLAVALLLAALAFAKIAHFFAGPAQARSVLAQASVLSKTDPAAVQSYLDEAKKTAEALKERNLFVKQPPRANPVKQVDGILGSEALIGGKWYKVGDKIGEAKVVSIGPTQVTVEWDGKQTHFTPMTGADKGRPEPPKKPESAPPAAKPAVVTKSPAGSEIAKDVPVEAVPEEDPLAWVGVSIPEKVRAKLLEKWNSMTDEQKEEAKRQWNSMSDEQKQQAVEAFERM
jgi:hypothetical protein